MAGNITKDARICDEQIQDKHSKISTILADLDVAVAARDQFSVGSDAWEKADMKSLEINKQLAQCLKEFDEIVGRCEESWNTRVEKDEMDGKLVDRARSAVPR